jgi:hypothetical protein
MRIAIKCSVGILRANMQRSATLFRAELPRNASHLRSGRTSILCRPEGFWGLTDGFRGSASRAIYFCARVPTNLQGFLIVQPKALRLMADVG